MACCSSVRFNEYAEYRPRFPQHEGRRISDAVMPEMDGYEFYLQVKEEMLNLPVILMTAYYYDKDHNIKRSRLEGAIFKKPVNPAKLRELLTTGAKYFTAGKAASAAVRSACAHRSPVERELLQIPASQAKVQADARLQATRESASTKTGAGFKVRIEHRIVLCASCQQFRAMMALAFLAFMEVHLLRCK